MLRSLVLRLVFRFLLFAGIFSTFVVAYVRIHDNLDSEDETVVAIRPASTPRTAQFISDDLTVHSEEIAKFDSASTDPGNLQTDIKVNGFGEVYVSMDGSEIVLPDAAGQATDSPYPFMAADYAGGVHLTYSDGHNVFLTSSADDGATWNDPVRLTPRARGYSEPSVAPILAAGDSGFVAIVWQRGERLFGAYTSDAFSSAPSFHTFLISDSYVPGTASASIDPGGSLWIAYRSGPDLIVTRHLPDHPMLTGSMFSAFGKFESENSLRRLSVNVRQDLTGNLFFSDPKLHLFMSADRATAARQIDGKLEMSGTGVLRNGSKVAFTLLISNFGKDSRDVSISLSNGYFASGRLAPPAEVAADLHLVAAGEKPLTRPQ
jgi:hypothetical protein